MFFGVVGIAQVEFRRACAVQPLAEELVHVRVRGFFDSFGEIGGNNVLAAIRFEIMFQAAVKSVFAELVAKHVENPPALAVSVAVEFAGIVEIVANDRLVPEVAACEPLAGVVPALVIGLVLAEMRLGPNGLQESGEALIQPDVAPIFAGDEIAEPLVAEFVRDQVVLAGEIFGSELGMNEGRAGIGRGAGIFHAARDEIIDHDLRIFFPWIVDANFLAEQLHHGRSATVVDREAVAAAFWRIVGDGDAAPRLFHLVEFARHHSNQVGGAGNRLFPIPGLQALARVADADELAV